MKRKYRVALVLVAGIFMTSVPVYAARRVVIDRNNYSAQQDRKNGCWLTMSRNFVVAQQPNRSAQSNSTVMSQYDEVCKTVKGTTADVTGDIQNVIDALNEFDDILGTGSHHNRYDSRNGKKSFQFIFDEITEDGDPIGITLAPSSGSVAHDVLINGADDGTNVQEVVRIQDGNKTVWAQYYDLENKSIPQYAGRSWMTTTWCD